ncbi:MAG TPA: TspO/MBR family protein [Anaerolineae bacterium]|nr:TspO/MBR family protein [Anaerolineae bacterium]
MPTRESNVSGLLIAVLLPIIGGGVIGLLTSRDVSSWYPTLQKPAWNPPNWIFGPVWTILYGLMGLASWLIWRKQGEQEGQVRSALNWYALQLGLNFLWSVLFFGLRRPDLALLEIVLLWGTILITITKFARIDRLATGLMIPYQLWVTFAAALNAAIWWLNRNQS